MIICLALLPSLPICAAQPSAINIEGTVVRVVDGDTLVFLSATGKQMTLRLAGIDAPEKGMAYGNAAKKMLTDLVSCEAITAQTTKIDRYGRSVAKLFCQGEDVNLRLIKEGMAWHYKQYVRNQTPADAEIYAISEREARARGVGLWQEPRPVPPWIYRKCHNTTTDRRFFLNTIELACQSFRIVHEKFL